MATGRTQDPAQPAVAHSAPAAKGIGKTSRRKWALWIASGIAGTLTAILLGIALILFLGIEGNAMVARMVRERIVLALQERIDPSLRLAIGAVDLKRKESGTAVRVSDFTVKGPDGRVLVSAPSGMVVVDTTSLFVFRLIPTEVVLDDLHVFVEISEAGTLSISPGDGAAPSPGAAEATASDVPPVERLQQFIGAAFAGLAAARDAVGGSLPALGISNAHLAIHDRRTGRRIAVREISARMLSVPDGGAKARVELKTGHAPFAVDLDISARSDAGQSFAARSNGLILGDVLALAGFRSTDPELRAVVDLGLTAQVDRDLKARSASAEFSVPKVNLRLHDWQAQPYPLQDVQLKLSWQDGGDRIVIDSLRANSGSTKVNLSGTAAPPPREQEPWSISLSGRDLPVEGLAKGDPAFELTSVATLLHAWPELSRLDVARFEATSARAQVRLAGQWATESDGRKALNLDLEARDTDARSALRLWPDIAAPEVRSWLVGHLKQGWVNQLKLKLAFNADTLAAIDAGKPLPESAIAASWHVSRAVLQPFAGAPLITDATASGTASGRAVRVDVTNGSVDPGQGRKIALPEGSFSIADFSRSAPEARVRLRFNGSAEAATELVRSPGIRPFVSVPLDPSNVRGSVEGEVTIGLRLAEKMGPGDIRVAVNAAIKGLSIDKAIGSEKIESGTFQLAVERDTVLVKGEARVFGAPATIEVRAAGKAKPRATLSMVLDDALRARKGYSLGGTVSGPVAIKVTTELDGQADGDMQIEADLTRAKIDGIIPGWTKQVGQSGRAKAVLAAAGSSGWKLDTIELDSGTMSIRGSVHLGSDGQFMKAVLPTFKVSSGDNARLDAERSGNAVKVTVKGNAIDTRPFLRSLQTGAIDKSGARDVEVVVRSTVLSGFGGEVVADASLNVALRGGELVRLDLSGSFDKGPVRTQLATQPGGKPTLTVFSDDAGAFLRFFDYYSRMQGGQLTLGATLGSGTQVGTIIVKDFILRNEPAMKRLVADAAAQAGGDTARIDPSLVQRLTSNQDVKFSKMTVEFARNAGRLDIKDAVIWGPEIGGSIAGYMDYARDRVELTGTFVPAYALNNFFAQVPVFGPLLGGGRNEGLFAIRYGITGKVSAPTLAINPLTAIAPGFLRKIIDIRGAAGPGASAPRPPPTGTER